MADSTAAFLYVDDTTLFDAVPMAEAVRHCTTGQTEEEFLQPKVAGDFDELGMAINAKKTQLLVISPPNRCVTKATLATRDGHTINLVDTMRLVGLTFGSSPGAGAHVEAIGEKYRKKKWMLYHLRDAGFTGDHLYKLYCCYVRSMIEYCSPSSLRGRRPISNDYSAMPLGSVSATTGPWRSGCSSTTSQPLRPGGSTDVIISSRKPPSTPCLVPHGSNQGPEQPTT